MRDMPLNTCRTCGGDWFREADYYEFLREESLGLSWPIWPDLVGQISMGPMTLLVCLCGAPRNPSIGGVRGGRTPNVLLVRLLDSLKNCHARLKDHHDGNSVWAAAEAHLATAASFQVLADQMRAVEGLAGKRIAQQTPSRKSPRGAYWALPTRKPASGDVLTLDTLVLALQGIGLTARIAKLAVKTIFEEIIKWLQDGGIAETPLGAFAVVHERRRESTLFRLGRLRKIYTKRKKVVFRPSEELLAACNRSKHSISKELPMPVSDVSLQPNQLRCQKCGSTHFVEVQFKQYRQQYSASPGGDIVPRTEDPVRVLVCLCGHPIQPKRLRSYALSNYQSFEKSFAAARQHRESQSPETILRSLAEIFAGKLQHDEMAERITKFETILKELVRPAPGQLSKP